MRLKNWIALALLASFLFAISGCGEQKNVIDPSQKTGLTPEERKSKRGD
jgi:hypothetical protein